MFGIIDIGVIFNIQILTVMKRTFISSLVESSKKQNHNAKNDKNMKPPTKSIFQQHKENIHPNHTYQNSTKKNQKLKSQSKFRSSQKGRSSNKKVQTYQPQEEDSFLSPFKLDEEQQERKQLKQELRRKCKRLKLLLNDKQQKELKKCRQYYEWIRQELLAQQMTTLSQINNCFHQAHNEVDKYRLKIDNLTSVRKYSSDFIIELPLLNVNITQEMKQSIKLQLSKFNLLNETAQIEVNKFQNKFQAIKFQRDHPVKAFQTPIHAQSGYNHRKSHQQQDVQYYGIDKLREYEQSPSFRHF